ncbi:MAG: polysaccharide pyruvyl transferase family protein [Clostridia bacterium]|nr:polysaccharide pyruvyl transferase family protein [Clostridia bacterium]
MIKMKTKVGILTFHDAVNYGAILQTVALYKKLVELGADAEIVDYSYRSKNIMDLNFIGTLKKRGFKKAIEYLFIHKNRKIRKEKLQAFLKKNAKVSKKAYTVDNIKEADQKYDKFVAGSDQIFDMDKTAHDENFLLNFVSKQGKKYSYAASSGRLDEENIDEISKFLSTFNSISVREKLLQEKLEKKLEKEVYRHLDPTFFYGKDFWSKYAVKPKEENYILVYTLAKSKDLLNAATVYAKQTKKKIIIISGRAEIFIGMKKVTRASIEEFLGYFLYADYIFTNSFHGTAFSIIMKKNFSVGLHKDKKMGNDRMQTLLTVLGLDKCYVEYKNNTIIENKINYKEVDNSIKMEITQSTQYLKNIVDN